MADDTVPKLVEVQDAPTTVMYGAPGRNTRRVLVHIIALPTAAGSGINVATYVPNFGGISGIAYENDDGATITKSGTASWSSSTIAFGLAGTARIGVFGYYT